jgi:hypothetical protein
VKPRTLDALALVLACFSALATAVVSDRVFERIPHIEDEFANLWQAEVMAEGQITLPSPTYTRSFLVPFVVDYEGERFGKYSPGWPATLSLGTRLGVPWLVNPLLGGLAVWLVYRLGSKIVGRCVGLLAALLTGTSPMFLMLSGTLMSHNLSLFLTISFSLAWFDLFTERHSNSEAAHVPNWMLVAVAGSTLGLLTLTRPLTALGVFIPFGVHGASLFLRGDSATRRRILFVGGLALILSAILLLWQAALTGDPFLNPYTLWWEYDRVGFGQGIGVTESGHNLQLAYNNTNFSLRAGRHDLFGWPYISWLFLPIGIYALRRRLDGWLLAATLLSLILVYGAYWIGSWLLGPRYYYEALPAAAVTSAIGVAWLGGWLGEGGGWLRIRRLATTALITLLIVINCLFYLPTRLWGMHGLYGISGAYSRPLQGADLEGALVFVHADSWHRYGNLLILAPPFTTADLLVAWEINPEQDEAVLQEFSERQVYHYYPDEPYTLYREKR